MSDAQVPWGSEATRFFYELTPERVLDAVEASLGCRCTGRNFAHNSMENRVYELEIEADDDTTEQVIAKFYRPGRWSAAQIAEEHRFLADLVADEIPAVAPMKFRDGATVHTLGDLGICYAVFPKVGGRSPDELTPEALRIVARLVARMHNVGAARSADHRVVLTPATYGTANLAALHQLRCIPPAFEQSYTEIVERIIAFSEPLFDAAPMHRLHGDCHLGNLLYGRAGYFWVDFDDMVTGPAIQDLWLLVPDSGQEAAPTWQTLAAAYQTMRPFPMRQLQLIEPLRALRMIHFAAWIAKRWQDPAFQRAFPQFGEERYWGDQVRDLHDQYQRMTTEPVVRFAL